MMQYKGYPGRIASDDEADLFHGELIGLRDVVTFPRCWPERKVLVKTQVTLWGTIFLTSGKWWRSVQAATISREHVRSNVEVRKLLNSRGIEPENLPAEEDLKRVKCRLQSEAKPPQKQVDGLPQPDSE